MQKFFINLRILTFVLIISSIAINAQHRGDNLLFQGLTDKKDYDVKSAAMGGAFIAVNGELSSLFHNPAGLIGLKKIQVSVSSNYFTKQWRENQNYRPDRYFVTLPFYLEGLYIPDPKNNGKWDYQLAQDTLYNYLVKEPQLGVDAYSEEAADWKSTKNKFGIDNISFAIPFELQNENFVFAASYFIDNNFYDFDRNDTYLDPHIGYYGYPGDITRVDGNHTMTMKWSRFLRERSGTLNNILAALAYQLNENISLSFGVKSFWGESNDYQSLIRVGSFLLSNQQRFSFSYENASLIKQGTSNFKSTEFNLSALISLNRFKIGVKANLPHTLTRDWNYSEEKTDSIKITNKNSGRDKIEIPTTFSFGFSFQPVDVFIVDFDYDYYPYNKSKYYLSNEDPTFYKWTNQNSLRFGFEFKAAKFLSLLAGYRTVPQTFVPDGAAITDKGPEAISYNFGFSLNLFFGRIDFAYELRVLKYYDSYFSNTNYAFEKSNNFMIGYVYSF